VGVAAFFLVAHRRATSSDGSGFPFREPFSHRLNGLRPQETDTLCVRRSHHCSAERPRVTTEEPRDTLHSMSSASFSGSSTPFCSFNLSNPFSEVAWMVIESFLTL